MNEENKRILIVDDNQAIHDDFIKILQNRPITSSVELDDLEDALFGEDTGDSSARDSRNDASDYHMDHAYQGNEAYEMVRKADQEGNPYALIFMDVRMPPGWDGVVTIDKIWQEFPHIEIVICTAFSDYSWDDIVQKLGPTDKLLFLKKPFDSIAVKQMALALTKKWNLMAHARNQLKASA